MDSLPIEIISNNTVGFLLNIVYLDRNCAWMFCFYLGLLLHLIFLLIEYFGVP